MAVPIAPPPVEPRLLAPLGEPSCQLPAADRYRPDELEAARACEAAGGRVARQRHSALAAAVRVRQKAIAEAVKAAR